MNMLVAGTPQLFVRDNWAKKMKVAIIHSANKMDHRSVATLSTNVDIDTLQTYRQSVGRKTHEIVSKLKPEEVNQKVEASRYKK